MATRMAVKRLTSEYKQLQDSPEPYIDAHPSEKDILTWVYVITGPPDTPFTGGRYFGTLKFPPDYPFGPPTIRMNTPSGRFEPGERLCLSMSDFHPETWNPAWNVSSILTGLLSFMCSGEISAGGIKSNDSVKRKYANASNEWNDNSPLFCLEFPELVGSRVPPRMNGDKATKDSATLDTNSISTGGPSAGKIVSGEKPGTNHPIAYNWKAKVFAGLALAVTLTVVSKVTLGSN